MAAGRHFKFANFDTLSRDRFQNENLRQHTKSHFKKKHYSISSYQKLHQNRINRTLNH